MSAPWPVEAVMTACAGLAAGAVLTAGIIIDTAASALSTPTERRSPDGRSSTEC